MAADEIIEQMEKEEALSILQGIAELMPCIGLGIEQGTVTGKLGHALAWLGEQMRECIEVLDY